MKRITVLALMLVLIQGLTAHAQDNRKNRNKDSVKPGSQAGQAEPARQVAPARKAAPVRKAAPARKNAVARRPVVINISRPSAGRNNQAVRPVHQPVNTQPRRNTVQPPVQKPVQKGRNIQQPKAVSAGQAQVAKVVHHQVYTQGYVRKKLLKIGVKTEPRLFPRTAPIRSSAIPGPAPKASPSRGRWFPPGSSTAPWCANRWRS